MKQSNGEMIFCLPPVEWGETTLGKGETEDGTQKCCKKCITLGSTIPTVNRVIFVLNQYLQTVQSALVTKATLFMSRGAEAPSQIVYTESLLDGRGRNLYYARNQIFSSRLFLYTIG